MLLVLWLAFALPVSAQIADYPPDEGGLEVSRTVVEPGVLVKVSTEGLCARSPVRISLEPAAAATRRARQGRPAQGAKLPTARADRKGNLSASVGIPQSVGRGAYAVVVNGRGSDCSSGKVVRAVINVADAPANKPARGDGGAPDGDAGEGASDGGTGEQLAFTGLALMILLGAGVVLVIGGLLLRRRVARRPA